ncbi:MAG: hypothetical protein Q4B29_00090 [Candidatus Saccharibacteria bacterium]|nr:hypothetical protein [Candidatus Saccharibacteria bacterium]
MERMGEIQSTAQQDGSTWENMANAVQAETAERLSTERQERKIIGYLLSGDTQVLVAPDVAISQGMREEFLESLAEGEFGEDAERGMLEKIRGPIDIPERGAGGERMFGKIMADPWQKQLFSFCMGREVEEAQGGGAVKEFLASEGGDLATPVGFEKKRAEIFEYLKPLANETQMEKYLEAMDGLEKTLYGKRFEYYRAFEGLKEEAAMLGPREKGAPRPTGGEGLSYFEQKPGAVEVFGLEKAVGEELLRRAEIDGDAWTQNGQEFRLTPGILKGEGLEPNRQMVIDGQTICVSDLFKLSSGRDAVLAYIPVEGGVKVRGYYKSNSQGTWRYMPDYVKSGESSWIEWFGKGSNEEAMTLPFEIQAGLAQIEQETGVRELSGVNADFLLAGTAKQYDSKADYAMQMRTGAMRGDYYEEVVAQPSERLFEALSRRKQAPESLVLTAEATPDFSQKVAEYAGVSTLVGKTKTEVYRSQDGRLNYLMCSDESGRSWVGGVETRAPITSTGLRREYAVAGDLATPLYDYAQQADGYGDTEDMRMKYQGMWKNYLSRVPVIQEYQQAKTLRGSQR